MIGTYDSVVAFVLPDGSSIRIDNLPATDAAGYTGLEDEVDYHTWRLLKGIAMATLLGVGTELTFGEAESDLVRAIRESTQQSTNRAGQRLTEKNLNIQPTITVSADLNQALSDYQKAYAATYGVSEKVADLIPFMLEAFLDSDRAFAKVRKEGLPEAEQAGRQVRSVKAGDTPLPSSSNSRTGEA